MGKQEITAAYMDKKVWATHLCLYTSPCLWNAPTSGRCISETRWNCV